MSNPAKIWAAVTLEPDDDSTASRLDAEADAEAEGGGDPLRTENTGVGLFARADLATGGGKTVAGDAGGDGGGWRRFRYPSGSGSGISGSVRFGTNDFRLGGLDIGIPRARKAEPGKRAARQFGRLRMNGPGGGGSGADAEGPVISTGAGGVMIAGTNRRCGPRPGGA